MLSLSLLLACAPKQAPSEAPVPAVEVPAPLNLTWAVRVSEARSRPEPLVSVMRDVYNPRLLVQATPVHDGLSLLVAAANEDGTQELCVETTVLPTTPLGEDGGFEIEGVSLVVAADGFPATLADAVVAGRWESGQLTLSRVDGKVDTRTFLPLAGSGLDQDAICTMMPVLGPCVACGDGGEFCWAVGFDELPLEQVRVELVPRDHATICADPVCAGAKMCGGG